MELDNAYNNGLVDNVDNESPVSQALFSHCRQVIVIID